MARSRKPSTRPAPAPRASEPAPPPPVWRDPWVLLVMAAVLPVLFAARGTPLGEPFSDDFLFLDFSVLHGNPSWWDGGGGLAYWRPLARQAYFGVLGPLMLAHPWVLALLHALALATAGVLIQRALRRAWPAPAAAAAAAFPLLLEPARTLVAWPSGAQDLGALVFLALALHAASRGRGVLLAAAGVAAALCKEVAAPLALLVAFAPFPGARGVRGRPVIVTGAALAAWAVARFALPHFGPGAGIGELASPLAATIPLASRFASAVTLAARDAFSLDGAPGWTAVAVAALALVPLLLARRARGSGRDAWRWSAWGAAWFVAGAAPLALFLPDWASFRSVLPAAGLGVALVAPLAFARAAWLLPVAAARLVAVLLAPQPPARLELDSSVAGDALSFPRLALLQRAVHQVRGTLRAVAPTLPRGATVMREGWPRMTGVAFADAHSLAAWYRDTTLSWTGTHGLADARRTHPVAMIEFEPHRVPQFAVVPAAVIESTAVAEDEYRDQHWAVARPMLVRIDRMLRDTSCARFRANLAGWRASCWFESGEIDSAEAEAGIAMGHFPDTQNGRFVIGQTRLVHGDWAGAERVLAEQVARYPRDEDARRLLIAARQRLAARR